MPSETGLSCQTPPKAVAVLFDPVLRCWEIVFSINASGSLNPDKSEYDLLGWYAHDVFPEPMSPVAKQMQSIVKAAVSQT